MKLRTKSIQDILGYREVDFSLREGVAFLEELSSGSGLGGPVAGIFRYRRTTERAELRGAHIQPHSEICVHGLASSMGPGLIVLSVCGVGWGEECGGAHVCEPCDRLLPIGSDWASLNLFCFLVTLLSLSLPLHLQPWSPLGLVPAIPEGWGAGAVSWAPQSAHSLSQVPTTVSQASSSCSGLLASASLQPPASLHHHCHRVNSLE